MAMRWPFGHSIQKNGRTMSDRKTLMYKMDKFGEQYGHKYVLTEFMLYMNDNQLEEFYEAFARLHPQSLYDEEGKLLGES